MVDTTVRHKLPLLSTNMAQKETTHNEALRILDVLENCMIKDRDLSTPPGSPANGDTYLVAGTGTGAWADHDGEIAFYYSGWFFIPPFEGLRVWVDDEDDYFIYSDGSFTSIVSEAATRWKLPPTDSSSTFLHMVASTDAGGIVKVDTTTGSGLVNLPPIADATEGVVYTVKKVSNSDVISTIYGNVNNFLLYSNDQSQSNWSKTRTTVTANDGTDPDGGTTLDKIEEDNQTGNHDLSQTVAKPQFVTTLIARAVFRADERNTVVFCIDTGSSSHRAEIRVNLGAGTLTNSNSAGDATYVSSVIEALANSCYRVTLTATVTSAAANWIVRARLYNGAQSYAGVTGEGLHIGRVQLTWATVMPTYVETTTAVSVDQIDGSDSVILRTRNSTLSVLKDGSVWVALKPEQGLDSGSFTPSISGASVSGSQTYTTRVGTYNRRGAFMDFWAYVDLSALDGATAGDLRISGLPFASKTATGVEYPVMVQLIDGLTLTTNYTMLGGYVSSNSSTIKLREMGSAVAAQNVQASAATSSLILIAFGTIPIN